MRWVERLRRVLEGPSGPATVLTEECLVGRLQSGAARLGCGEYIASEEPVILSNIYTNLLLDRFRRKIATMEELHAEVSGDWNRSIYMMYFRTLADKANQSNYLELARRVPYHTVMRERLVPHSAEAMLFGASGLLALFTPDNDYIRNLQWQFEHLAAKYDIRPMSAAVWEIADVRPANNPILRIAQAAEFLRQELQLTERIFACNTEEDVRRQFCCEAPPFWNTFHLSVRKEPDGSGRTIRTILNNGEDNRPKRIGAFKANIIGINLVAVMQFAYGSGTGNESLRNRALSLMEQLPAEDNRYTRAWRNSAGPEPANAFESQALLQLATEYCAVHRCKECPIGRRLIHRLCHNNAQ